MNSKNNKLAAILLSIMFLFSQAAMALISIGRDGPVEDHGWPVGSVEMANLPTRVSWWVGPSFGTGSMYEFQYECETAEQFTKALKVFAGIRASKLELAIHNGPKPGDWPERNEQTDWTFRIWNPKDWDRLKNTHHNKDFELSRSPVPSPRIDVYAHAGGIKWEDVKVPVKVLVTDTRPGSIDPEFAGAGLVDVQVVDMSTGKAICDSKITLMQVRKENTEVIRAVTDTDGKCRIAKIPNGYYEITIEADGYVSRKDKYDNRVPSYGKYNLPLSKEVMITGIVEDTHGEPVKGVKIVSREFIGLDGKEYPSQKREVVSDSEGKFEMTGIPVGFCKLRCMDKQWHMTNSIFVFYPVPGDAVKIVIESTATIHGKITATDGTVPGGTINISIDPAEGECIGRWGYGGYVPKDGKFEITGIPPDEYSIVVKPNPSPGKYQPDERVMKIEGGRNYTLDIVLKKRK